MRVTKDTGRRKQKNQPIDNENSIITDEDLSFINSLVIDNTNRFKESENDMTHENISKMDNKDSLLDRIIRLENKYEDMNKMFMFLEKKIELILNHIEQYKNYNMLFLKDIDEIKNNSKIKLDILTDEMLKMSSMISGCSKDKGENKKNQQIPKISIGKNQEESKIDKPVVDSDGDIEIGTVKKNANCLKKAKNIIFRFSEEKYMLENFEKLKSRGDIDMMIAVECDNIFCGKMYYIKISNQNKIYININGINNGDYIDIHNKGEIEKEIKKGVIKKTFKKKELVNQNQ